MAIDISQFVVMGTSECCYVALNYGHGGGHGLRLAEQFFCDCFHFTFTLIVNEQLKASRNI